MSGADNMVFNTREKPISQDFTDLQALEARTLATVLRFWNMSRVSGLGGGADTEMINPVVNGLQVVPSGSTVLIQPGFLLQESATVVPTPGTFDSPYRIALNHVAMNPSTATPAPAGNTYYLLEAQMQELTTLTESRNILNATTGNFVATSVPKRKERRLLTQWIGTDGSGTYPAPTGGDWVVLAGVFRPAGGGAVLSSHIQDMRLQPDLYVGEALIDRTERPQVNRASVVDDGDTLVQLSANANVPMEAPYNRALRLSLTMYQGGAPVGFDAASVLVKDTTTTFAANTWYYVYLTTWYGLAPRTNTAGISSRGVLVVSHIKPSAFTAGNSAVLNLPAPFSAYVPATGWGKCIAILRRNSANTGWMHMQGAGEHHRLRWTNTTTLRLINSTTVGGANTYVTGDIPAADLPRAQLIDILVLGSLTTLSGSTGNDGAFSLTLHSTGDLNKIYDKATVPVTNVPAGGGPEIRLSMQAPYDATGLTVRITQENGAGVITAGLIRADCTGWTF